MKKDGVERRRNDSKNDDIIDYAIYEIEDERELSTLDGKAIILAGRCF